MTLDFSDPLILEAAREVDAMLPGTPPIAPTVELPAEKQWANAVSQRDAMLANAYPDWLPETAQRAREHAQFTYDRARAQQQAAANLYSAGFSSDVRMGIEQILGLDSAGSVGRRN